MNIKDKRSVREIILADKIDIEEALEYLRIKNDSGVRELTINIISMAVNDLKALRKRVKMFYEKCASGKLTDYYETPYAKNLLPFRNQEDVAVIHFFNGSQWGNTLLGSCDLEFLPPVFKVEVEYLEQVNENWGKYCNRCLRKAKYKEIKINENRNKPDKCEGMRVYDMLK